MFDKLSVAFFLIRMSILAILRLPLAFEQRRFNVDDMSSAPCIGVNMIIQRSLP